MARTKLGDEIRTREIEELKGLAALILLGVFVALWLAGVPARIAVQLGVPFDWAYSVVNGVAPLALMFLVMGVVLAIRWIGSVRH